MDHSRQSHICRICNDSQSIKRRNIILLLHRWTPYVAPFPASHSGNNISIGLDTMIEELGLDGSQWELFAVNDNAANVKLGIQMSSHLSQHLCDIHTLELCVKDTFENTLGMKTVLKKTKKLAKFVHKSTVAARELKREAKKQQIPYRKIANPPNTRWSGRLLNLSSCLRLQKPLMHLTSSKENWHKHNLTPSEWRLIGVAVALLEPVRDTVLALEGEKEPTMDRVLERIYTMHCLLDEFISNPSNSGIGFGRELRRQLEKRFPEKGTNNPLACMANFLSPKLKGIDLEESDKLESTKDLIEKEWNKMKASDDSLLSAVEEQPGEADEDIELSPTSKLRKKMQARAQSTGVQQRRRNRIPPIRREMIQYETFTVAHKESSVLEWWRGHETILSILSKVAKKVLTVPASSSKSERVFSTGANSIIIIIIIMVVVLSLLFPMIIIIIIRWELCHQETLLSCPKESRGVVCHQREQEADPRLQGQRWVRDHSCHQRSPQLRHSGPGSPGVV